MRKLLFTFFGLILCSATCLWAQGTTTQLAKGMCKFERTVADIASKNDWKVTKPNTIYNSFDINADIHWTSESDNGTYNGTGLRVYESRNNYNPTTISVTNGWIDSISITYVTNSSTGVLCSDKNDVSPVPDNKKYLSGRTYPVEKSSFSFYLGRTDKTQSNGRPDITVFKVFYTKPQITLPETLTVAVGDVFQIGQVSPTDVYHVWESGDESKITVDQNGVIVALATTNSPVQIKLKGKGDFVRTCSVTVVAREGKTWQETFSKAGFYSSNTTKEVEGDSSVYNWALTTFWRENKDAYKVDGKQAVYLRYDGYNCGGSIASKGNLEGGIKAITFKWKNANPSKLTAHFVVSVGGKDYEYYVLKPAEGWISYQRELGVKSNAAFAISLETQRTPQQGYMYVSPITITPYLLFTTKSTNVNCKNVTKFDLKNIWINNTGEQPTYTITTSTGCAGNVTNGVLDLSDVIAKGDINITAKWQDVTTTTKLVVTDAYAAVPEGVTLSENAEINATVDNRFQIIGTVAPATANPKITWSSDKTGVVDVDQNGIVDVKTAGEATITATAVNGVKKTCTITVSAATTDTTISETFKALGTKDEWIGTKDRIPVNGDGILKWIVRGVNRASGDKVGDVQWTRLSKNSYNYIAYNNNSVDGSTPMEGGVKRVSFQWKAANSTDSVIFDIDNTGTPKPWISHKTKLPANSAWTSVQTFTKDVKMNKNTQFRIKVTSTGAAEMIISPITITPYLLFTNKAVTATDGFYKFNDADLINNTGTTLAQANFTVNDETAASVEEDGTIKSLKDNQTITLTAKWGDVTTTTKLTTKLVDPEGSFALGAAVITKNIGDADFDNAFNKTVGDAFTYKSTNEDVATVDENGKVHIVNGGTTQIKAVFAASAPYNAKEFAYTLDVGHTPTEPYFAESYDSIPEKTVVSAGTTKIFAGTAGVYSWEAQNMKYRADNNEKIDGKWAINLINNVSHFTMVDTTEGGIKEVAFRYKSKAGTSMPIHFYVRVGSKVVEMARPGSANVLSFAHQFNVADSVGLSIYQGPEDNPKQGHILFDTIKIVPYLLYTKKVVAASAVNNPYKNDFLIDNTTGIKPVFSISCPADVAEIDPETGEVTIHKSDTVTVTATWGKVKTTYTLQMQAKPIPEISFADASLNKDLLAGKFTNALISLAGVGDTTYTSSNEDVATVDANGEVTMHSIGEAKITVNIAESDQYAATSLSYNLTVGFTPAAGTFWTETFSKVPDTTNYTGTDKYVGDSSVYNWAITYYQRQSDDMIGTYQGTRIRYSGALAMDGVQEGGVKAVRFDYRAANQKDSIHFKVNVGNTDYEYKHDAITVKGTIVSYARKFEVKKNTQFAINMDAVHTPAQGYPIVGPITITPYLLYTKKAETINLADYQSTTYTNDKLINNTDVTIQAGQTDIEFSVVGQSEETDKIATVNKETGAVTPVGGGTITVQAKWGEVTTTYELTINKMTYTPAFAKTEEAKTMNDSTFTIQLNDVPADAGARTYSSTNERVAKANNEGVVTIYGPGKTDIKVEIAENAKYKKANAQFTLTVSEPTTDTDVTEGFTGLTWGENATSLNGDLCTWNTYKTRRSTNNDSLISKGVKRGAEWMQGETALGYLESNEPIEGGVKRIYFTWFKNPIKSPATGDPTFMVKVGDVEDVFNAKDSTQSTEHVYLHNFNMCKNSVIKIFNNSSSNFKAGPIVITPYIFFTEDLDVQYASVKSITFSNTHFVNNTESKGVLTFKSSDETVATVTNEGVITPKKANETPITITATWKPAEGSNDSVTASYKLTMHERSPREAYFDYDTVTVQRGETPVNELHMNNKTSVEPIVTYSSSDTQVAIIEGGVVKTICPGVTTIKAVIQETDKYMADSVTYTLIVTYIPKDSTYFTETFSITNPKAAEDYVTGPDTIAGSNGYSWELKRYRRKAEDLVNGVPGTRICYNNKNISNAYLATVGEQEGGLKEVVFDYCVPGVSTLPIHFYVQAGDSTHEYYHVPIASSTIVTPYAHVFSKKSNTTLSIYMNAQEDPAQSALTVSPVKIIPYLLYTRKDTTVVVKDMESPNFKFFNNKWINNTDEGTISYSVKAKDNAVTMEGDSVKILKEGTDTIQASWEEVTTTYVIHVVLEEANLQFAKAKDTVLLETGTYKQEATTVSGGTVTYEFEGEHGAATITDSTVTFNGYTGKLTIMATVPVALPHNSDTARYELQVNKLKTPTIIFNDTIVDMNNAPFNRPAASIPSTGMGQAHYNSSDKAVATVGATSGLITIIGQGQTTISVHFDEGDEYMAADASFKVTVTDPMDAAYVEDFKKVKYSYDETKEQTITGKYDTWVSKFTRREGTAYYGLTSSNDATWFHNSKGSYLKTKDVIEGGIKRVRFLYNRQSPDNRTINFVVAAGDELQNKDTVIKATIGSGRQFTPDSVYNHNFLVKKNVPLSVSVPTTSNCYLVMGDVKITPYLRFKGEKVMNIDLDDVKEVNLNDTIYNNTENGTITFAVDSFKTDVAPTIEGGKVDFTNVNKGGKVYISATWAENPDVKTTLVINTTITPEVNFEDAGPVNKNLVDGSFTNVLVPMEGLGTITYESSNKQVATVDNNGVVTFLVAGTTTIKAKVAASDIYNKTEKSYNLTINGYTPAGGEAWVETFSLMEKRDPYVTTEEKIAGDSSVYSWKANEYIRPNVKKPFRLHTNGYIKTNGRQEGGMKYVALNWIAAATGNIDFTMKVNNDSYQYKGGVTVDKAYCFEHFFNADSICPLEIKIGSENITAYMSVVNVTVVPYLLYTKKTASIKIGETYTNTNLINNLEGADKTAVQYSIVEGSDYATIKGDVVTGVKAGTVKVKAYLNDQLYTTYQLTIVADSEITLDETKDNSKKIAGYDGIENMTVHLIRTLTPGMYNTFCVPFTISKEELESKMGTITSLATLVENTETDADLDDTNKNLSVTIEEVTEMQAGKPYLINPENKVENPTFDNVTIIDADETSISGSGVTFYGIVSPHKIMAADKTTLFLVSENRLAWNNTGKDSDLKGMRAYFNVPGMNTAGVAPRLVMRQPSTPTEVENVNANANANRKMIINNQLIIIRDGKMFNAQGALVK